MWHTSNLASVITAVLFPCVFASYCLAAQDWTSLPIAKQWESIATIRLQIANDHEVQSGEVVKSDGPNFLDAGDLLSLAGDKKLLASENYKMASQCWEKAAAAYKSAGNSKNVKRAEENAKIAIASAKRALSDGVELYIKAKELYEVTNVIDKKIDALDKIARNLKRLMEMK